MAVAAALPSILNSELAAVLAVMRRNVRWGGSSSSRFPPSDDDHYLVRSLKSLRRQLFVSSVDPLTFLRPFLDVIRSDETGAPITGVAISSLYKILSVDALDPSDPSAGPAMDSVIEAVTGCRFEVTDPASEEAVLMKILQVLLACFKCRAVAVLSNQHVCTMVNTCFRIVHQASSKSELLQRFARHTMHELVRCIFSHLADLRTGIGEVSSVKPEMGAIDKDQAFGSVQLENGNVVSDDNAINSGDDIAGGDETKKDAKQMVEPFGVPCMIEILHFLCSLLNVDQFGSNADANQIAYDEDVPLFALGMINSVIELGGASIKNHPEILNLIQDELFYNLVQFGLSMSPLVLSMVSSIVMNLYQHLRTELKLQIEAFFSCVTSRLAHSNYGASYHQQEVLTETVVDFCRQKTFVTEMYANLDCDITCTNVFEELVNLLSKSAFPVNSPLSSLNVLALDGLIAIIQGMADRIDIAPPLPEQIPVELVEYTPFWVARCENYFDPDCWVKFVRHRKFIKRKLLIGADHFNRDAKKGLEFLQGTHLLPEKIDPQSVACFFRYTTGLDKNIIGDYLGNHDDFCIQVLHEFVRTFDFEEMSFDTALRLFLETFWLPGEAQKIQRVLEAFAERYYEQSPQILVNNDAALLLAYSLILLNTDQHNVQVKKKMTEEDFIRNNRRINGGNDLPREFLSELYHSICMNEIKTIPKQGVGLWEMTPSRWVDLMWKSKKTSPYILCDSRPFLDHDMFAIMAGPTVAAICVVLDYAENEEVSLTCLDALLDVAKISAYHQLVDVLDDLVVSLCKFTTLLTTSFDDDPVTTFGDDVKARFATETVFGIVNKYGDYIRTGWRSILDCILRLHKLGLLPARVVTDAAEDSEFPPVSVHGKSATNSLIANVQTMGTPRRSAGLIGRFSQILSFDAEEPRFQPTEQQLAAPQRTLQTVQKCHIDSIFTESKFLHADSLMQLVMALIGAAGRPQKASNSSDDEDTSVFCLELLIVVTLNNRDRIKLLWPGVYEHMVNIVQSTGNPCPLVEKAVFGLLRICQRLLPYKENLADDLLKSLQLVLKLDARVADDYCERITQEVTRLVKANAIHIKSQMGWRTITSLLSITARHPEASEAGFEALMFIMSDGAHVLPVNFVMCIEASRQFAESRVGLTDRSIRALDLMAESVNSLARWSHETREAGEEADRISEGIREMWLRLVQAVRKVCLDKREEVRNHALLSLQRCLVGVEGICLSTSTWVQTFDLVIFTLLDDLLEVAQNHSPKDYRNMETTLLLAIKLLSKVFLQLLTELFVLSSFCKMWLGVLSRMDNYMKFKVRGKKSEKLHELIPELLKNTLLIMKTKGILSKSTVGGDNIWELTWLHVKNISPSLQSELFTDQEVDAVNSGSQLDGTNSAILCEPVGK